MFKCSDEVMVERLKQRGLTSGRSDDNEETIHKRLKTFHEHTIPVIFHYQQNNKVWEVSYHGVHLMMWRYMNFYNYRSMLSLQLMKYSVKWRNFSVIILKPLLPVSKIQHKVIVNTEIQYLYLYYWNPTNPLMEV